METVKKEAVNVSEYALLFKLMSDENRLKILLYLKEGELCVCNLIDLLDMSQPSVSQHLKKLREASVISIRRHGQWKFYRLNESYPHIKLLQGLLEDLPSLKEEVVELHTDGRIVMCEK